MPRNAIYYADWKRASANAPVIRYRWEMTPAYFEPLSDPDYIDIGRQVLEVDVSANAKFEGLPIGLPDAPEHEITLSLDDAPTDFATYIMSPVSGDFITMSRDGSTFNIYDGDNESIALFNTSNLWTLYSDCGDTALEVSEFKVLFQGVQKRSESIDITGGTLSITLLDVATHILNTMPPILLGFLFECDQIETNVITLYPTYAERKKNSKIVFDMLYEDDGEVYGKADWYNETTSDAYAKYPNEHRQHTFYPLHDLYDAVHTLLRVMYAGYIRKNTATVAVTATPDIAITRYRHDYTTAAGRGTAIDADDIYFMGWGQVVNNLGSGGYAYGYLHRDDALSVCRRYQGMRDWLHDLVKAQGARCRMRYASATEIEIVYEVVTGGLSEAITLSDIIGKLDDVTASIGYNRLRGCTVVADGLDGNSVREVLYADIGSGSETDEDCVLPLHGIPTSINDSDHTENRWSASITINNSLDGSRGTIFTEHAFFCDKLVYFDQPSFSTAEYAIVPHWSIDYSDGSTTYSDVTTFALPTGLPNRAWLDGASASLRAIIVEIQRRYSQSYTVARALSAIFGGRRQTLFDIECEIHRDDDALFGVDAVGRKITFDPSAIRSYFATLPSTYYVIECSPDYKESKSAIKMLGMDL